MPCQGTAGKDARRALLGWLIEAWEEEEVGQNEAAPPNSSDPGQSQKYNLRQSGAADRAPRQAPGGLDPVQEAEEAQTAAAAGQEPAEKQPGPEQLVAATQRLAIQDTGAKVPRGGAQEARRRR